MNSTRDSETTYRGSSNIWVHVSAGGILLRPASIGIAVFLLKEDGLAYGWSFPRGTVSDEGNVIATVIREVEEEAGYQSQVITYLGSVLSTFIHDGHKIHKTTLYHVMAPSRGYVMSYQNMNKGLGSALIK